MSQGNQFHQYGYNHYLKAPAKPSMSLDDNNGLGSRIITNIMNKLKRPFVAIVSLIIVAVLFLSIIIITYPFDGENTQQNIPIIRADLRPIKTQPVERGGMSIANIESTIMAGAGKVSSLNIDNEVKAIENLLMRFDEENNSILALVNKEAAIDLAMEQNPMASPDLPLLDEPAVQISSIKEPIVEDILQKIDNSSSNNKVESEFNQKVALAAISAKPKVTKMHAAAAAPETLDFVRNILNERASSVSAIEPAVGMASSPAANISAVSYFVQLASITDPARASSEWRKMQTRYGVLSTSKFRVQEVNLTKGTFYRIQAGPMSKDEASKICNALKAQGKAGGCLVVK